MKVTVNEHSLRSITRNKLLSCVFVKDTPACRFCDEETAVLILGFTTHRYTLIRIYTVILKHNSVPSQYYFQSVLQSKVLELALESKEGSARGHGVRCLLCHRC